MMQVVEAEVLEASVGPSVFPGEPQGVGRYRDIGPNDLKSPSKMCRSHV
mgnify:CR=1 FL=1